MAVEIIRARRGYHLPIYRQQDWFGGSGWMPSRSKLLNIEASAAELTRPLVHYFQEEVLGKLPGSDPFFGSFEPAPTQN